MFNKISALRNKSVLIVILIVLVSVVPFSHFIFFNLLSDTIEAPSISENKAADNTNKFVPEEGVFYMGIGDSLGNMDIHSDDSSYLLALNVYDRLFEMKTDSDGKPVLVNSLVKKYSVTPDGKSYNFELRENVGFSDGTPLTAYDVEYSFTRMLSNEDSVQQGFVDMIDGASELLENKTDTLRGIKIDDDTHFTINLSAPFRHLSIILPLLPAVSYQRKASKMVEVFLEKLRNIP